MIMSGSVDWCVREGEGERGRERESCHQNDHEKDRMGGKQQEESVGKENMERKEQEGDEMRERGQLQKLVRGWKEGPGEERP